MIKNKFKIEGMHCASCAMSIDMELEDLEGVKSSNTSYAKGEVEVEYDNQKISEKQITEIIKKLGYKPSLV